MTINKLRRMLDSKEISAAELTRQYLDKITKYDGELGAFLHVNGELAISQAEEAQKLIDAGNSAPLTGIPLGIKDLLCTKDMPTTCASKMLEGYVPPYDATVISRLREQNAVLIGKTNMDEFAMGASNQNSYFKPCKNPHDLESVPGGSSGGSAAAVAAGMCAAALGSDTGGSIRQPASFCGITGHRPTYGAVSRYGAVAMASSLDQVGPMALSAWDCAVILDAIGGKDSFDQTTAVSRPMDFSAKLGESVKGKRIGVIAEFTGELINAEVRGAVEEAARWYEQAGAIVEKVSLPILKDAVPAYYLISCAEASTNMAKFDGVRYGYRSDNAASYEELVEKTRSEGFGEEVKRRIILGTCALCSGYYDEYYKKAVALTGAISGQYDEAFSKFDALLSPAAPTAAYKIGGIPSDPAQNYTADICTVSAPLAGLPSISSPCGYTGAGLPVGFMLTGPKWSDPELLALADAFEGEFVRKEAVL